MQRELDARMDTPSDSSGVATASTVAPIAHARGCTSRYVIVDSGVALRCDCHAGTVSDLLASLKEMREVMAAMMRVVAMHDSSIAHEFGAEIRRVGVAHGFGVRAQNAIAKAERK